jgi:hypothetical protein
MAKLQTQLKVEQPSFLNELKASDVSKKAKRFKITMAASMAV